MCPYEKQTNTESEQLEIEACLNYKNPIIASVKMFVEKVLMDIVQ